MINKIQNWIKLQKQKSARRAEIMSEIAYINEMARLNHGISMAAINSGRFPPDNYGKPEYSDYAARKHKIKQLERELSSL